MISPDGLYRYHLWRVWDEEAINVVWIMLNPSTADAKVDDMTIRKCVGFSQRWGYGSMEVINLYALRATNPDELVARPDRDGPDNVEHWGQVLGRAHATPSTCVVAAWGANADRLPMGPALERWWSGSKEWKCLGLTRKGHPAHPGRLAYTTRRRGFIV